MHDAFSGMSPDYFIFLFIHPGAGPEFRYKDSEEYKFTIDTKIR
jgi:hypothetical protein